uniref:Uncharacterized protein n=1 Tax=Clastoptera arizonana TaxID=38151 RepID=A0A1B6DNR5_9HEMI
MADHHAFDKSRDSRRKKFFTSNRDKEEKHYGARRLPIILTKPESEREGRVNKGKLLDGQEKPLSQPTIILRTREGDNRALSPSQRSLPTSRFPYCTRCSISKVQNSRHLNYNRTNTNCILMQNLKKQKNMKISWLEYLQQMDFFF